MKIVRKLFLLLLCSMLLSAFSSKDSSGCIQRGWEMLGERSVNFKADKDEIMVTASEGRFSAVQIRVKRAPINMQRMVIHFGDGEDQTVELKDNFRAGGESRIIDLEGKKRVIRKVSFWYDTKGFGDHKAIVQLWGRH